MRLSHRERVVASGRWLAIAVAAWAAAGAAAGQGQATWDRPTIVVRVVGFRNSKGALECSLFAGPKGFPQHAKPVARIRTRIAEDRTGECRFAGVAPGTYAVGVMHDENDNGKFDQGPLGVPKEGYGFSNNHTHALSAPTWDECRFNLAPGENRVVEVRLRY